jgi:hypothetical protein
VIQRKRRDDPFIGDILAENQGLQKICKKLGFHLECSLEDQVVKIELEL